MFSRRAIQLISQFASVTSTAHGGPVGLHFKALRSIQSLPQQMNSSEDISGSRSDTQRPNDATSDILKHPDYFEVKKLFTVKEMFQCGVHYGHMAGTLDHRMRQFIFGKRFDQLIFDLDMSAEYLRDALNVLSHVVYRGGIVLFICRDAQNCHLVEQTAIDCGEYAHTRFWNEGVLTNSTEFFRSSTRLPDIIVFLSTLNSVLEQHSAVQQAAMMNIPAIGVVDSNCNPNLLTYPVPGNDDSPSAVSFYCHVFKTAIQNAKKRKAAAEKAEKVSE